jgi:hypothetical protein
MSTNQIYSHAETQKIIAHALECSSLLKTLSVKETLTDREKKIQDSSIKHIRNLMGNHWFYGYLSEEQFKELSTI